MKGHHVAWFNPREMDDETVTELATGRRELVRRFFSTVQERLNHPGSLKHWLVTGSRGAGKSFFLRLVQASFQQEHPGARFVLLAEEHRNIYSPHEFLNEARRLLSGSHDDPGLPPAWSVSDTGNAWKNSLRELLASYDEPLLVIGVENFDELLSQAFKSDVENSRLRHLMSNEPRVMILATAIQDHCDHQYGQRMFRQFEHHALSPWSVDDHRKYLARRAHSMGKTPTELQMARIDAYSRFTGGNARVAAVLAGTILDDSDPLKTAHDLDASIEKMSEYYNNLILRMPANTRKLFDALVRGGEPATQSEVAERIGAKQNEISRAFLWLMDQGYISEYREPGKKTKDYRVCDRLFVQFYRMRVISPGQRSKLSLLADLLADTLSFKDKWHFASLYAAQRFDNEAHTLIELAMEERAIDQRLLPEAYKGLEQLLDLGADWERRDAIAQTGGFGKALSEIIRQFPSDEALKREIEKEMDLIRARKNISQRHMIGIDNFTSCPVAKLWICYLLTHGHDPDILEFNIKEDAVSIGHHDYITNYPFTVSLDTITVLLLNNAPIISDISRVAAIDWAVQAVLNWYRYQNIDCATTSLRNLLRVGENSIRENPLKYIYASDSLNTIIDFFPSELHTSFLCARGLAFLFMRDIQSATQCFTKVFEINAWESQDMKITAYSSLLLCYGWLSKYNEGLNMIYQIGDDALPEPPIFSKWKMGQQARFLWHIQSPNTAWALLECDYVKSPSQAAVAISQLGDIIADKIRDESEHDAFSCGCLILEGLAEREHLSTEDSLKSIWVDMIQENVPLVVMQDLLGEWARIFGTKFDTLNRLLRAWLDYLFCSADERIQQRKILDPDLVTTFCALNQNLPYLTKVKHHLIQVDDPVGIH